MKTVASFIFAAIAAVTAAFAAPTPTQYVRSGVADNVLQAPIVGSTTAPIYSAPIASIAALRALNVTTPALVNGASIQVSGYYAANDGGGGTYVWNSASTTADNGGTVIASNGVATGRWLLQYTGAINVKWFGATGNGTTDDTVALQYAIDCATYGLSGVPAGTKVVIPPGTYKITNTIFLGYPEPAGVGYVTAQIEGVSSAQGSGSSSTFPTLVTAFASMTKPAVVIESGRGSSITNVGILGQMTDSYIATNANNDYALRDYWWDKTTFVDATINAQSANVRRYSPYAGIVSNAYSGAGGETSPAPYPVVAIPTYLQAKFGITSIQYGTYISGASRIENDTISCFDVGLLFNAFSANNGDRDIINKDQISFCCYGVSTSQPNMRQMLVRDSTINYCYVAMTDNTHGLQNGSMVGADNCQFNYDVFWVQSTASPMVLFSGCYGEGGGSIGSAAYLQLRSCQIQINTYNNYTYPVVSALDALTIDGLHIQGSTSDSVENYFTGNFPIPYVIQSPVVSIRNVYLYDMGSNQSTFTANRSFLADINAFNGSDVISEGKVVYAMTRWAMRGLVIVNSVGGDPIAQIHQLRCLNNSSNFWFDTGSYQLDAVPLSGATLSQRTTVPMYVNRAWSYNTAEEVHVDQTQRGNYIDPAWSAITESETTNTYTISGNTYSTRNIYLALTYSPNSLQRSLVKGWTYTGVISGNTPIVMVCVQNPTDTGIANTWKFKVIYGFDGRTSHSSGWTTPTTGNFSSYGFSNVRPTRVADGQGPIIATFTSASSTVTIDTSYGVDATKLFEVGDVIAVRPPGSPGLLGYSGTNGQKVYSYFQVASITNSSTIVLNHNAPTSGTYEIYIN